MPAFDLRTKLADVRGISPATAAALASLGVRNVGQLVAYLPFRHETIHAESPLAEIVPGTLTSARGEITATRVVLRGKQRLEAALVDDTGRLDLVWFNMLFLRDKVHPGAHIRVQGKAQRRGGALQMVNPLVEVLPAPGSSGAASQPATADERIRPVYPANDQITSGRIEKAVLKVLPQALPLIADHLSPAFLKDRTMPGLAEAYRMMHAPAHDGEAKAARRRLAYDELLLLQLALAVRRAGARADQTAPPLRWTAAIDRHIRARFPFPLTPAQNEVVAHIAADLQRPTPAHRLIQGDVGSGKTVVALYAMLMAAASGKQAALMAPTELLAEQHHASITGMLKGSDVKIALLTGTIPDADRRAVLAGLADGSVDLVIGTHALLTGEVVFKHLGVAVIDEQHRFGVRQRARLRSAQAATPHTLVMTATPIPRTLALTLFGDMDVSLIKGMPPGRKPVRTRVVSPAMAPEVYAWLAKRLDAGDQAYIVAPAIDPGDEPGALASVRELHARLQAAGGVLAGRHLAVLHGRLNFEARAAVMARFREGKIHVLIATTVIEVGVDVPNATIMVIEHAERFGLAQLHQLRGRVGRGPRPAACVLIAAPTTPDAEARLAAIAKTTDGFRLAEADLEIRGFGDVAGARQAGLPPFRVAQLPGDLELLSLARRDAEMLVKTLTSADPAGAATSLLRTRMEKAHGKGLALSEGG
ncbi:MAG: ATP-dependent DNA helicase RecG [Phycisphaerales bacterium]